MVVLTVEVDPVTAPQLTHQAHRLAKAGEALFEFRPLTGETSGDLIECLSGTHTEEDPVRVQTTHGGEGLGDHGGVVPEGRRQHRGTQRDSFGALTDRGHPRQREGRVPTFVAPRLEMVAHRRTIHAVLLREHAEFDQFPRRELLRRRLVSQFQFSHALVSTPVLVGRLTRLPKLPA